MAVLRLYKGTFVKRLFWLQLSPNYVISVETEFEQLPFNAFKLCISNRYQLAFAKNILAKQNNNQNYLDWNRDWERLGQQCGVDCLD